MLDTRIASLCAPGLLEQERILQIIPLGHIKEQEGEVKRNQCSELTGGTEKQIFKNPVPDSFQEAQAAGTTMWH